MEKCKIVNLKGEVIEADANAESSMLTLDEELELIERVKQCSKEAEEELMKVNVRVVTAIAKNYLDRGVSEEELLKAGKEGLIKAANKYDASKGFKFLSYAVWWIRQSIIAAVGE